MMSEPSIPPYIHPFTEKVLNNYSLLGSLYCEDDSAYNIVFPDMAKSNLTKLESVFKQKNIKGYVQYAHKPNKSLAIVKAVQSVDSSHIDIASSGELKSALQAGFTPNRICATGPKNTIFIKELIKLGVRISIDSISELHSIILIKKSLGDKNPTSVFARINAESLLPYKKDGRFGILKQETNQLFDILIQEKQLINFVGFAFHLNFDSAKLRPVVFEQIAHMFIDAKKRGLQPLAINIGGGFRINYVEDCTAWNIYTEEIKKSALGKRDYLGWDNGSFGFWSEEGVLRGHESYMALYHNTSPEQELADFFDMYMEGFDMTIEDFCKQFMIEIIIEPGRAVLDSAGITVAKIQDIKRTSLNNNVIILDINRSQLAVTDMTYMMNPILLPHSTGNASEHGYITFVAGNLCLDSDIICKNKVRLCRKPCIGDLICFVNTAGYFMDFSESKMLQHKIAKKYVIYEDDIDYARKDEE